MNAWPAEHCLLHEREIASKCAAKSGAAARQRRGPVRSAVAPSMVNDGGTIQYRSLSFGPTIRVGDIIETTLRHPVASNGDVERLWGGTGIVCFKKMRGIPPV